MPRGGGSAGDRGQQSRDRLAQVIDPLRDERAAKAKRDPKPEGSGQDQGNGGGGREPPVRSFVRE